MRAFATLPLAFVITSSLWLNGCGSSGDEFESPVPPPPAPLTPHSVLDIASGVIADTGTPSDGRIVFVQVPDGSNSQSSGDSVTDKGLNGATITVPVGSFFMVDREITIGQWKALVDATGALVPREPWLAVISQKYFGDSAAKDNNVPAYGISYDMITKVTAAWNGKSRNKIRVPTSREWEHACRTGKSADYFWGENPLLVSTYAVVAETTAVNSGALPVEGSGRSPNGNLIFDMLGNVWEWVSDGGTGNAPCLRGGSWKNTLLSATCGNRIDCDKATPYALAGVRLVLYQE